MSRQAEEGERIRTRNERERPAGPFPRYERISEELADAPRARQTGRERAAPVAPEEEIPHTESFGELWARASRRSRRGG